MFHSWNQAFRIIGFLGWCPNTKPSLMSGTTWRMAHLTILCISNHQMARSCDHHTISFTFWRFSVIRGLAIAALPWMLDLWSSCQTVFVEQSSRWMSSSAVTFAAVLLWFIDTILFSVRWSLSLNFGFWSLFLLADDVLPWCVCCQNLGNCCSG